MTLELTNNLTKNKTLWEEIEDKNNSTLFFSFDICLEGIYDDGEYTYRLLDGEDVKATGLLQIGDYKKDENINKEYTDNNGKTYIVYGE